MNWPPILTLVKLILRNLCRTSWRTWLLKSTECLFDPGSQFLVLWDLSATRSCKGLSQKPCKSCPVQKKNRSSSCTFRKNVYNLQSNDFCRFCFKCVAFVLGFVHMPVHVGCVCFCVSEHWCCSASEVYTVCFTRDKCCDIYTRFVVCYFVEAVRMVEQMWR